MQKLRRHLVSSVARYSQTDHLPYYLANMYNNKHYRALLQNYQKSDTNIEKLVTPGNFIEFPIEWRKSHCSKFIRLEMTSKTKLLLKVENGEKIAF